MSEPDLHPESVAVAAGRPHDPGAALNPPIVVASAYRHDGTANRYQRHDGTPTIAALEAALGALDGGEAVAFASGMAATAAVVEGRPAGAVAVVPAAAYSGSIVIFDEQQRLGRMQVRPVDTADTAAVIAALDGADLLWLESVSNPLMAVPDLPALIGAARERRALVVVDATFSTPLNLRPLALGADVVMHSVTKFLSGHADLTMGALVARPELAAAFRLRRGLTGATPGALECYLALRGIRTLPVRWERAQANTMELARRLARHPRVSRVRYPGLPGDPFHAVAARDHAGFGAMLAFELDGSAADAERVCAAARLITHCTSLGGVETTMERRARHDIDATHGTPPTLIRVSVGIEHVEDLWADLSAALG
jgi:cystathionine gamma-synthase